MTKKSGIYTIHQIGTRDCYVGSSMDTEHRWREHRQLLRRGTHHAHHLQNAWNKYGEFAFEFEVLEECEISQLLQREQYYIDLLKPVFNTAPIAGTRRGVPQSLETIEKVRKVHKGKKLTDEVRAHMSAGMKGVRHPKAQGHEVSKETRAKIAAGHQGKPKEALRGRALSEEHREKIAAAQRGVPRPQSRYERTPEIIEKQRQKAIEREARKRAERAMTGERGSQAKLTTEQIREIRELYAVGNISQQQLADRYGVKQASIWRVLHLQE